MLQISSAKTLDSRQVAEMVDKRHADPFAPGSPGEMLKYVPNIPRKAKSVYVIGFQDNAVKIGISQAPATRIKTVAKQSGRNIERHYVSAPLPHKAAFTVEADVKKHLSPVNANGEFFAVEFSAAVIAVKEAIQRITGKEEDS